MVTRMHFLWITTTFWTFKISRRTMHCGPFVRIVIAFAFDLYSPHDPTIFCKLLPSEAQQLNLIVGSRAICTFKDNKLILKEAFCVLGLAFYISQREKTTMFLTLLCLSGWFLLTFSFYQIKVTLKRNLKISIFLNVHQKFEETTIMHIYA